MQPADLIGGDYLVRFEARTLDDIRALGGNDEEDERKFAAVARISEINLGLYRTFVQPWVQAWANEGFAEWMRQLHPLRLQYEMFSHANPFLQVRSAAHGRGECAREPPVGRTTPIYSGRRRSRSRSGSRHALNAYRDLRDHWSEALFHAVYGSPFVQALVGLKAPNADVRGTDRARTLYRRLRGASHRRAESGSSTKGGPREAALRALLYIRMPEGVVDERGFNLLRRMREEAGAGLTLARLQERWCASNSSCCCSTSVAPSRQFQPCSPKTPILLLAWPPICCE